MWSQKASKDMQRIFWYWWYMCRIRIVAKVLPLNPACISELCNCATLQFQVRRIPPHHPAFESEIDGFGVFAKVPPKWIFQEQVWMLVLLCYKRMCIIKANRLYWCRKSTWNCWTRKVRSNSGFLGGFHICAGVYSTCVLTSGCPVTIVDTVGISLSKLTSCPCKYSTDEPERIRWQHQDWWGAWRVHGRSFDEVRSCSTHTCLHYRYWYQLRPFLAYRKLQLCSSLWVCTLCRELLWRLAFVWRFIWLCWIDSLVSEMLTKACTSHVYPACVMCIQAIHI